jgi:hypothetical protein
MACKKGHVLNYDGYCRLCGAWLVDVDGPQSPFHPREQENQDQGEDHGRDDD